MHPLSCRVIAAGFPEGWQKYWAQTFVTLSDRLATDPRYATPGKTVWVSSLGVSTRAKRCFGRAAPVLWGCGRRSGLGPGPV